MLTLAPMKQHGSFKVTAMTAIVAFFLSCAGAQAFDSSKTESPAKVVAGELGLLENRFFSRQYLNDPLEKRLERLELLVFASTQDGSGQERLSRLKKALGARVTAPGSAGAKNMATAPKSIAPGASEKKEESSSQYPVLNTLEWRALKKTFGQDSLDQRLERMETKLFGQPSPSMAYVDRVERLKRTLGIGLTTAAPSPQIPAGPMPKARPRSQMGSDYFGWSTPAPADEMPGVPGMSGLPGLSGLAPGFPDMPSDRTFGADISRTFADMFKDMNRQMQELNKMGPGQTWTYDPQTGTWSHKEFRGNMVPAEPRQPGAQPRIPVPVSPPSPDVPPYADPNSI